ncbi:hypothetical protein M3C74_08930 [Micrococcus lylae]|uniref:hypothetical protein n=1 Tax=Micrococcus lylae TaxID=1273 RepID=UPI000C80B746|nr:hypothetical protein [Micrococcus lylae]MCT2007669.1 hypothetical protein [Micrococcus lylae]MCT2071947.1 hypothetical protein [Micrococcus lylae]WIK81257.1 hypothetical protein CJ228_006430 [Micrococcus lylae]
MFQEHRDRDEDQVEAYGADWDAGDGRGGADVGQDLHPHTGELAEVGALIEEDPLTALLAAPRRRKTPEEAAAAGIRGPGTPGTMQPGERASVLIVAQSSGPEDGIEEALDWIEAFERDCGLLLDTEATASFAVASADVLQDGLCPPRTESPAELVEFILFEGVWYHRGNVPAAPPDDNGVSAWGWMYHRAISGARPDALCSIWDVYPLPCPGQG